MLDTFLLTFEHSIAALDASRQNHNISLFFGKKPSASEKEYHGTTS